MKFKRVLAGALVCATAAALFTTGCGKKEGNGDEEAYTIDWYHVCGTVPENVEPIEQAVDKYLEGKLNVKLKLHFLSWTPYAEHLNVMMAGGDTFDIAWVSGDTYRQNVAKNAFLPLDDYIKESEYLRSEDHFAPVFDTGKTDEGQVVLPITYYASVFLLDKAQLADPDFTPKTWDELVNCEDTAVLKVVRNNLYTWCGAGIPRIADYATEKTILTEENLTAQFEDLLAMPASESFDEETALIQSGSYAQTDEGMAYYAQNKDTVNALAIPNTEGGVTAFITSYAAINRNSPKADEVFRFFELLFSDEAQIDTETVNDARGTLLMLGNLNSFLTHKNAYLQPELLESVQSRVNAVRFYSVMDYTIYDTATTLTWEENPDCAAAAHSVMEALQTRLSE